MKQSRIAFFEGNPVQESPERVLPESILLIRYGINAYTKNNEQGEFEFTEEDADTVIADFETRGHDLVIDYEHQSLSGEKAPAAGWIGSLEKTPEGILAHIRYWTDEAQSYLLQGQYRYFSPTLYFSRSGKRVTAIHSAALTNHPAMHSIPALVAADSTVSADDEDNETASTLTDEPLKNKEENMNDLLDSLGLEAFRDADEEQRQKACSDRIAVLRETETTLHSFLERHGFSDLNAVEEKMEQLRSQEAAEAVRQAFADGKLAESMRSWAEDFAAADLDAFHAWTQAAPRIVPDNAGIETAAMNSGTEMNYPADSEEARILRLLGLTCNDTKKKNEKKGKN